MAQRPVPESVTRRLYCHYFGMQPDFLTFDSRRDASEDLPARIAALPARRFVVKPDHLIGKRGKSGLLGLNLTAEEAAAFVVANLGKTVGNVRLTRFMIMPFFKHETEAYVSLQTEPEEDVLLYSDSGGVDIEENQETVRRYAVGLSDGLAGSGFSGAAEAYLERLLAFFRDYGFSYLEINPLAAIGGEYVPLDFKARLDTAALFSLQQHLDVYALLADSAEDRSPAEAKIAGLDALTDASLKLTVMNPNGRIWPMVAGGGASLIYFDGIADLGLADEIGFYGEYSGNPSYELTYQYAATVLDLMLASSAKGKVLLLGGANANFTDIVTTFAGIERALEERQKELKRQGVMILVRRGGPRVKEAFARLRAFAERAGLHMRLEGTERPLTAILSEIPSS